MFTEKIMYFFGPKKEDPALKKAQERLERLENEQRLEILRRNVEIIRRNYDGDDN